MTPMLEMDGVTKTFGHGPTAVNALTDLTLRVAPAEIVALMGPSGCGKSTLLHLAGGLEVPTAGQVRVDGIDLATLDATRRAAVRRTDVGYVFQKLNLILSLTALENVMLPLELDGVGRRDAAARAEAAMAAVDLPGPWDRFPDDFSGGQQQRIAIARATVGDRRLLLADEPTGALDTASADRIVELLAELSRAQGRALVLVTHEPRFASWADRVVFLRDGRVVDETGSSDDGDRGDEPSQAAGPNPDGGAAAMAAGTA
jgi:putative ABC transport system ATP-binding protein